MLTGKPAASWALYAASCNLVVLIPHKLRRVPVVQPDESGVRGPEPAAAEIERVQGRLEVHVEPLAPGCTSPNGGYLHQPGADSVPPKRPGDHRVEDERVSAAVPGNVDEPSQIGTVAGADPAQAVPFHLRLPVVDSGSAAKAV